MIYIVPIKKENKTYWFSLLCAIVRKMLHIVFTLFEDKKEEIWPSPMTKAPIPTEMSKGQSDNTNNATKKFD